MRHIPALLPLLAATALAVPGLTAQTTITGRLTGAGDHPIVAAHVTVMRPYDRATAATHPVGPDGRFSITVRDEGLRIVQFTGVGHLSEEIAIVGGGEQRVEVDVRLATLPYVQNFDGVQVIGDFNDFSWETGVPMTKGPDGVYRAAVEARGDSLHYQLLHVVAERSVNGTDGERWQYDGGGDYESIVPVRDGRAVITFDPSKLVRSTTPSRTRFAETEGVAARVDTEYRRLLELLSTLRRASPTSMRAPMAQRDAVERFRYEDDRRVREVIAGQFMVASASNLGHPAKPVDADMFAEFIHPEQALFALGDEVISGAYAMLDSVRRERFFFDVAMRHPDLNVRFNAAIGAGMTGGVTLAGHERARLAEALSGPLSESPRGREMRQIAVSLARELRDTTSALATVSGRLVDTGGKPVANAMVAVASGAGIARRTAVTDAQGRFAITTRSRGMLRIEQAQDMATHMTHVPLVDDSPLVIELRHVGAPDEYGQAELVVSVLDSTTVSGRVAATQVRATARSAARREAWKAHSAAGGDQQSFRFDMSPYRPHADWLEAARRKEPSDVVRAALLFEQIELLQSLRDSTQRGRLKELRATALKEVPPSSPLWAVDPDRIAYLMWDIGRDSTRSPMLWAFLDRFEREQPDDNARAETLYRIAEWGHDSQDQEMVRRSQAAMQRLEREYPGYFATERAQERLRPRVKEGSMVPAFTFAALGDASKVYTRESMKGKVYLIDLWATWCGPCIGELPSLHDAYEKYHDRGFEILSVSFDASPEEVSTFRSKKWRMPWLHSFSAGGFGSAAARLFGVTGIPQTFLVDREGRIIAADLRGRALAETLERVLGDGTKSVSRE